ncbi:MAG: hypothetical protein JWO68_3722 [Actinomycetia bacterium]|nr:hypothetical protein [Actinomycetes bacterium]
MNDFTSVLADDLADLAGTMPPDPTRLTSVRRRARRLRSQRLAARGVTATATVAIAVGGLAAVQPGPGAEIVPTGGPTLPSCASVPASTPTVEEKKAADAAGMTKVIGTISALPEPDLVTVTVDPTLDLGPELTFAVGGETLLTDGTTADRAALHVGDTIALVVQRAGDGKWTAVRLDTNPPAPVGRVAGDKAADVQPAGNKPASGDAVDERAKAVGTVHGAVTAAALEMAVTDGPLAGQTITLTTDDSTEYLVGDTPCARPELVDGATIGMVGKKVAGGYHVERLFVG